MMPEYWHNTGIKFVAQLAVLKFFVVRSCGEIACAASGSGALYSCFCVLWTSVVEF